MPTYEYVCETCGHGFEAFQSMKDPKLTDCPLENCSGNVRRLLGTGAGLIFKGSGFYETDYRSASYKEAAKKDQGASQTTESSSSSSASPAPKESKGSGAAPAKPSSSGSSE